LTSSIVVRISASWNEPSPQWMSDRCAMRSGTSVIGIGASGLDVGRAYDGRVSEVTQHSLVTALRSVPDLHDLDDAALLGIVGASSNLFWAEGSTVFEAGSESEALYLVLSGEVRVTEGEEEIDRLGPGESFGELSLLSGSTHSRTARATEATELMVIAREDFQQVLESNPALRHHFAERHDERAPVRGEVPAATDP
jgi:hypothetical protein